MATAVQRRSARSDGRFAVARAVADAVLYEGYLLYPYRRSAVKNANDRVRWQFGVLAPKPWIERQQIPDPGVAGSAESWFQHVDVLAETPPTARLHVQLRFLQLQRRQVHAIGPDGARRPVERLDTAEGLQLSVDEAVPHELAAEFQVAELLAGERAVDFEVPGSSSRTQAATVELERTSLPLQVRLTAAAEHTPTPFPALRLRIQVENTATPANPGVPREHILRNSLLATHLLLGLDEGRFLSLLDPPAWAAAAASGCANRHQFPVLAGADGAADVLLCSPIILYDHPKIAPESPGDLHDAAEIDEILSLRTLTLTDAEKREARATDPRAAAIIDRIDTLPPELLARLHGTLRDAQPAAQDAAPSVLVDGQPVTAGARVRLRPRGRGSDAYDMFLAGRTALVHEILHDVDGSVRLAVTVEGDPAAELAEWYGRYFHFRPEEVEFEGDGQ